ncbi:Nif3-like dinuclear metal center hexameric protein, partial [Lutimonas sp.]|uniref:Nif3-like dinuclear metal center hexameric protein n=1 Tax=Lutimonas sp. TaxID=1872403 RepID=UPI003C762111
ITAQIEQLSPLTYAEDFDNVGLLVGNNEQEVEGVLVSLDCLETTIDEAIEKKCNLIVSFHPIIFKGLKKLNGKSYVERTVIKAIKHDIAIYAMHTALDNSFKGVSAKMAEMLDLENTRVLMPQKGHLRKLTTYVPENAAEEIRAALFQAGAGHIGNYSHCSFNLQGEGTYLGNEHSDPTIGQKGKLETVGEHFISVIFEKHQESKILQALDDTHPYEEIAYDIVSLENVHDKIGMGIIGELKQALSPHNLFENLKRTFDLQVIKHSEIIDRDIKKVAVLGGSGSFAIEQAINSGADIFITADLKYHDFYRAEGKLILADIGHYESEQFTKNLLVEYLTKKITNFAPALPKSRIILAKNNTNPINYF